MKPIGISKLWKKHLGDWGVNVYNGCEHGCVFCYSPAQPGVKAQPFWKGKTQADWGRFNSARDGLVEALQHQLRTFTPARAVKTTWGQGRILVSFLCDAYQPLEEKLLVTRQVLELLLQAGHRVRIQTRATLVRRDFNLLLKYRDQVQLGTSLPHLDDVLASVLEPNAPAPTPQLGYSLTPHIKLDRVFRYFGALSRFAGPAQLFPASYLYPDAKLQGMEKVPAAMFADILPNLGSSFPLMDETPNPWNILVRLNGPDCYYGYPFSRVSNPVEDTTVSKVITGSMTLPNGKLVQARNSESFCYATLDAKLKDALKLERYGFHDAYCLDRGVITHDGLPFILPTEMQTSVFAVILTSWELEMDKPGDLTSYTLKTQHSAIRGYNFYQKTMSLNSDFDRWMGFPDDVIGKYPQEVKSAMSILTAINHVYYAQQPNNFRAWRQSVCPPTDELAIPSKPSNTKPSNTKKLNKTVKQSKNMTTTSLAEPTKAKPAPATPTTATTTPPENTAPVDAASLGFGASSDDDADRSEAAATAKSAEQNRGGGTSLGAFVEGTVIHKSREGSHFFRPIAFPGRPNLVADVDDPSRLLLRWWMRYTLYRVADRASGQDSGGIICRPGEVLLKQARIALYQHPEIGPRYKAQTQTGFSINTSERIVFLTLPFDGNGLACAELLDLPISRDKNPKKPTDAPKRQCGDDLREMPRAREDDPITLANMGLADGAVPPLKHGAIYSLEKGRIVALHQQGTKETMVRVIEAKSVYPLADVGNKVKPAYIGLLQDAAARFGRQPMEKLLRYSSKEDQINWVQMIAPADFGAVALRAMGVKNAPVVTAPVEHGEPAVQE